MRWKRQWSGCFRVTLGWRCRRPKLAGQLVPGVFAESGRGRVAKQERERGRGSKKRPCWYEMFDSLFLQVWRTRGCQQGSGLAAAGCSYISAHERAQAKSWGENLQILGGGGKKVANPGEKVAYVFSKTTEPCSVVQTLAFGAEIVRSISKW